MVPIMLIMFIVVALIMYIVIFKIPILFPQIILFKLIYGAFSGNEDEVEKALWFMYSGAMILTFIIIFFVYIPYKKYEDEKNKKNNKKN